MKAFIPIVFLGLQLISNSSFAVFSPGWARPVLQVNQMTIFSTQGELEEVSQASVTLHKEDGPSNNKSYSIVLNNQIVKLEVVRTEEAGCGSIRYIAKEIPVSGTFLMLEILDHTTRLCKDLRPYLWEAQLNLHGLEGEVLGSLKMGGNPEPVFTILGSSAFKFQIEQDQYQKASFN